MKLGRGALARSRIAGALRVLGLLAILQFLGFALWLRAAHARTGEALLSIGAELMNVEGARFDEPARSLFLNGITVHLRTATTDREPHTVLNQFHAICRTRTGVEAPQAVIDKLNGGTVEDARSLFDGVFRVETGSEGAVACIDTGTRLSIAELTTRLQEFAQSGDLSAVGELRYVLARRVNGKTAVLTLWTEGSTPLLKMFPSSGDAPGRDPEGLPRAPETRRLLSAWENGQPYSVTLYTAPGDDVGAVRAFYETALRESGWSVEAVRTRSDADASAFVARRGSQTALLRFVPDSQASLAISIALL